ncbi:hypothetical protein Tco_1255405 [Tanacetum coccineum]
MGYSRLMVQSGMDLITMDHGLTFLGGQSWFIVGDMLDDLMSWIAHYLAKVLWCPYPLRFPSLWIPALIFLMKVCSSVGYQEMNLLTSLAPLVWGVLREGYTLFCLIMGFPTGIYMRGLFNEATSLGNANYCTSRIVDGRWTQRGISIQCPEASASPLRSIPAEGLILKQPLMSQPAEDTSSDGLLTDGNLQLTYSVSCKAEAISPLMNVLRSRVSLTEEHQRLEFP